MDKKMLVTYCGLYGDLCDSRSKTPERAAALRETMKKGEYEDWGPSLPDFVEFWRFLEALTQVDDDKCCRSGKCGAPNCAIRKCAIDKGLFACPECDEYPCDRIRLFAKSEPTLIHDGERFKQIGIEAWIEEQEERKRCGFNYGDIRCCPAEIPKE